MVFHMTQNDTNYNVTQYNVIVGSTSGNVTSIPPSTTTIPQVLTSNGVASNPSFQNPQAYSFSMARQVFTASGIYTPTANMEYCIIECVGGGGGSGNITGNQTTTVACNGGGAGGSYTRSVNTAAQVGVSQTITIGAGGASAGTGGTTSVGTLNTAPGGGAKATTAGGTDQVSSSTGGLNGNAGTGGTVLWQGTCGRTGTAVFNSVAAVFSAGGRGGSSFFGGAALGSGSATTAVKGNGNNGTSYGGGGGGPFMCSATLATATAGSGAAGIVIVTEFIF